MRIDQAAEEIVKQIQEFNNVAPIDFTYESADIKELRSIVFRILLKYAKIFREEHVNEDHV